jgi:hypothetical protein
LKVTITDPAGKADAGGVALATGVAVGTDFDGAAVTATVGVGRIVGLDSGVGAAVGGGGGASVGDAVGADAAVVGRLGANVAVGVEVGELVHAMATTDTARPRAASVLGKALPHVAKVRRSPGTRLRPVSGTSRRRALERQS